MTSLLLPLAGLLGLGVLACSLIWTSRKSVFTRILYTLAVILLPLSLAIYGIMTLKHSIFMSSRKLVCEVLAGYLEDETIPPVKISSALRGNAERMSEQFFLLQPPQILSDGNADEHKCKIHLPVSERSPETRCYHSFPVSSGRVDYSGVPGFRQRVAVQEKQIGDSYWEGKGVIVTGQLKVEDSGGLSGVASGTAFLKDGVFVHAIYPAEDRELQFFKSGYNPLAIWIDPKKKHLSYVDLGVIELKKAQKTFPVSISFRLPDPANAVTVTLRTGELSPTWRDSGYECAAPIRQTVASGEVKDGEVFGVAGLSAIPYELAATSPGCVERTFYFTGDHPVDFGRVDMLPAHRVTFRLRPFHGGAWEKVTLEINGKASLTVGPDDQLGNQVDVELVPDRGSDRILASFPWAPVYFDDYGKIRPDTGPLPEPKHNSGTLFWEPGHLYRMRQEHQNVDKLIYVEPRSESGVH